MVTSFTLSFGSRSISLLYGSIPAFFGDRAPGNKLGTPLYLSKVWIRTRDTTFTITVDHEPKKAGIDPYNKLIDRDPKDNVKEVSITKGR